jgi:hypothetical protein
MLISVNSYFADMDRTKLPKDVVNKLSGYTWIKIGDLSCNSDCTMTIRTKGQKAENYRSHIESTGGRMVTTFDNKATIVGDISSLINIAKLDFVEYVDIGLPMGQEGGNTLFE